jgi:isopentenyl-diphosphate delta-isomerase
LAQHFTIRSMKHHHIPRVDVTDREGNPLGYQVGIDEAYRRGLWHRAAHVLVYTPQGEVLVQQRSRGSVTHAGQLDISAAGGVDPGETPLQAAARETAEELGIHAPLSHFEPLDIYRYNHAWLRQHIHPRTILFPFLLRVPSSQIPITIQESEVEAARFVNLVDARRLVRRHGLRHWGRLVTRYPFYRRLLKDLEARL